MATDAQIKANRENAKRSTGPTSAAGKAQAARNSVIHGFTSLSVMLPGDDPDEFAALLEALTGQFQPQGLDEQRCVREMVDAEWRLGNIRSYQEVILTRTIEQKRKYHPEYDALTLQAMAFSDLQEDGKFAALMRYETKFERQYERARATLLTTRERKAKADAVAARAARPQPRPVVLRNEPNFPPRSSNIHLPALEPECPSAPLSS